MFWVKELTLVLQSYLLRLSVLLTFLGSKAPSTSKNKVFGSLGLGFVDKCLFRRGETTQYIIAYQPAPHERSPTAKKKALQSGLSSPWFPLK